MLSEAIDEQGRLTLIEKAIQRRDYARQHNLPDPVYVAPHTGDTVIPRRGTETDLVKHRSPHFLHPSELRESGLGTEKQSALKDLEGILGQSDEFIDMQRGILAFHDQQAAAVSNVLKPDFDYGFHILWAKARDNQEYGMLVLNRVPHSDDFKGLLNTLGTHKKFEDQPNIEKYLVTEDGQRKKLGNRIHLATVQLKNKHLYRENTSDNHSEGFLKLGDWQLTRLLPLYNEFTYYDPDSKQIETVQLSVKEHPCAYSAIRYNYKPKTLPGGRSQFCQQMTSQKLSDFDLEAFGHNKGNLKAYFGNHAHFYLARLVLHNGPRQKSMF